MVVLKPFKAVRPSYEFAKSAIDKEYTYEEIKKDIEGGRLFKESKPMLYIYKQKTEISQTAIIGEISCETVNLLDGRCHAAFLYKENEQTKKLIEGYMTNNTPDYNETAENGNVHELWAIKDDNVVNGIIGLFEKMDRLYYVAKASKSLDFPNESEEHKDAVIAHLYSSATFKAIGTRVLIENLNGNSIVEFLRKIEQSGFEVKKVSEDSKLCDFSFGMYIDENFYEIAFSGVKRESLDIRIDVFRQKILSEILGIENLNDESRIKIKPDISKSEKSTVTFLFRSFMPDEIMHMVDKKDKPEYEFVNLKDSLDKGLVII